VGDQGGARCPLLRRARPETVPEHQELPPPSQPQHPASTAPLALPLPAPSPAAGGGCREQHQLPFTPPTPFYFIYSLYHKTPGLSSRHTAPAAAGSHASPLLPCHGLTSPSPQAWAHVPEPPSPQPPPALPAAATHRPCGKRPPAP